MIRPPTTIYFDCDGVVLDSNSIKTQAFHDVARQFSTDAADALVEYHVANGGISRYAKFRYLAEEILGRETTDAEVDDLSRQFGDAVYEQLLVSPVTPGLADLREATRDATWCIVSGGAQHELRRVFAARGLDGLFDGGIFGSPTPKPQILRELAEARGGRETSLFIGDSRYDYDAAEAAGIPFVFAYGWTEMDTWPAYCAKHGHLAVHKVADLIPYLSA